MPKGSKELTDKRKEEIINACASLYETMSFKDISLKEISKATSFTRTSIYNYFQTKEEIFLALLEREYYLWIHDLESIYNTNNELSVDLFSQSLAKSLEKRNRLLKLLSMNHYDLETNARMENLIQFKVAYGKSIRLVSNCLEKFFERMSDQDIQDFIYSFFPFLFGVYPYTVVTDKQQEAMEKAKANYVFLSIYEIIYRNVKNLLRSFE